MHRSCRLLIVSALLCYTPLLAAEATSSEQKLNNEQLKALQKSLSGKRYLTVDFKQTIFGGLRGRKRTSEGRAQLALPGSFKWQLEKPIEEQLFFNGKDFIQYRPDKKVATKFPSGNAKSEEISELVSLVLDFDKLLSNYQIQKSLKKGKIVDLTLRPNSTSNLEAVELKIDSDKQYVTWLKLLYSTGGYTELEFDNPDYQKIDEKIFDFNPPKDVKFSTLN